MFRHFLSILFTSMKTLDLSVWHFLWIPSFEPYQPKSMFMIQVVQLMVAFCFTVFMGRMVSFFFLSFQELYISFKFRSTMLNRSVLKLHPLHWKSSLLLADVLTLLTHQRPIVFNPQVRWQLLALSTNIHLSEFLIRTK